MRRWERRDAGGNEAKKDRRESERGRRRRKKKEEKGEGRHDECAGGTHCQGHSRRTRARLTRGGGATRRAVTLRNRSSSPRRFSVRRERSETACRFYARRLLTKHGQSSARKCNRKKQSREKSRERAPRSLREVKTFETAGER